MNSMTFKKDLIGVQNDLLRFAYKLTSDREEANDLLQETSLKALQFNHIKNSKQITNCYEIFITSVIELAITL